MAREKRQLAEAAAEAREELAKQLKKTSEERRTAPRGVSICASPPRAGVALNPVLYGDALGRDQSDGDDCETPSRCFGLPALTYFVWNCTSYLAIHSAPLVPTTAPLRRPEQSKSGKKTPH